MCALVMLSFAGFGRFAYTFMSQVLSFSGPASFSAPGRITRTLGQILLMTFLIIIFG